METTFEENDYVDELTLNTLKTCVKEMMQITGTLTSFDACSRLFWIKNMIEIRARELKVDHAGELGVKLESVFHQYSSRQKYYLEFKQYALSLLKAVELMMMFAIQPEDEDQAIQLKVILSTIRGAHEELHLWVPGEEFPCEF